MKPDLRQINILAPKALDVQVEISENNWETVKIRRNQVWYKSEQDLDLCYILEQVNEWTNAVSLDPEEIEEKDIRMMSGNDF